jgi:hypothetical protein
MPTNPLEELLRRPIWRTEAHAWKQLTSDDTLFVALHRAVQKKSVGQARQWTEEWETFVQNEQTRFHQWNIIRTLVWCAEQAIASPQHFRTEVDRSILALADVPRFVEEREEWAWCCVRTFLDVHFHRVEIPVVGWNQRADTDGGFLATLVLEVSTNGAGQLTHHPADVFCTVPDDQFRASMNAAWAAARNLLGESGSFRDGRWRLLQDWTWEEQKRVLLKPAFQANGRSASGAAVWGWRFALTGKVPDEGIIIIAQVDENDVKLLKGFGGEGVFAKTKKINDTGGFDTIVVASTQDEQAAVQALGDQSPIRVVNLDSSRVATTSNDEKRD